MPIISSRKPRPSSRAREPDAAPSVRPTIRQRAFSTCAKAPVLLHHLPGQAHEESHAHADHRTSEPGVEGEAKWSDRGVRGRVPQSPEGAGDLRGRTGRRQYADPRQERTGAPDRKSTRLNSSHLGISYAVF